MTTETNKLQEVMESLKSSAAWIGEDGAACVNATSEEEAFVKFKELMAQAMGDDSEEEKEMKIEDVGIGWLHLPKEVNSEFEWFVSYTESSPFEVFTYQP